MKLDINTSRFLSPCLYQVGTLEPAPRMIAFVVVFVFLFAVKGEVAVRAAKPKFVVHADAGVREL
jgi:hypothetical protein